jgi:hypothetical protein
MNEIIILWNQIYCSENEINVDMVLNILLFADDKVLLSDSEDDL